MEIEYPALPVLGFKMVIFRMVIMMMMMIRCQGGGINSLCWNVKKWTDGVEMEWDKNFQSIYIKLECIWLSVLLQLVVYYYGSVPSLAAVAIQ